MGNDGKPSADKRHVGMAEQRALSEQARQLTDGLPDDLEALPWLAASKADRVDQLSILKQKDLQRTRRNQRVLHDRDMDALQRFPDAAP